MNQVTQAHTAWRHALLFVVLGPGLAQPVRAATPRELADEGLTDRFDVAVLDRPSDAVEFGSSIAGLPGIGPPDADGTCAGGRCDLLIGAQGYADNYGIAYVFEGETDGPRLAYSIELDARDGDNTHNFGNAVASGGDLNGDGLNDIAIAAKTYMETDPSVGAVGLLFQKAAGETYGFDVTVEPMILGTSTGAMMGYALTMAGDTNGDGLSDLVVSATGFNTYAGRVYIYHGQSTELESDIATATPVTLDPSDEGVNRFGKYIALLGDLDGSGQDELCVGAQEATAAQIYVDESETPVSVVTHRESSATNVSCARLFEQGEDPYFGVGSPNENTLSVYPGASPFEASPPIDTQINGDELGLAEDAAFGVAALSIGDLNEDLHPDVLVSGPYSDDGLGAVVLLPGPIGDDGEALLLFGDSTSLGEVGSDADLGVALAAIGDVDGDGCTDAAIGDPGYNLAAGADDEGRVLIVYGSPPPDDSGAQVNPKDTCGCASAPGDGEPAPGLATAGLLAVVLARTLCTRVRRS